MSFSSDDPVAYLSAVARSAVICGPEGLVRLAPDGTLAHDVPARELEHFLQLFPDVEQISADREPFPDVLRELRARCELDALTRLTLSMLDDQHSTELRARSGELLGARLASDPAIQASLLARLLSLELPQPLRPRLAELEQHPIANVGLLFGEWSAGQLALAPVRTALQVLLTEQASDVQPDIPVDIAALIRRHHLIGWLAMSLTLPFREGGHANWAALDAVVQRESPLFSAAWRAGALELLTRERTSTAHAVVEAGSESIERLRQERDLFRNLLDLGIQDSLETLAEAALALLIRTCGARKGYLELFDRRVHDAEPLRLRVALGGTSAAVGQIQDFASHTIIAEAVASGEPVVTASALIDERFRDRPSVQLNQIEAVLCVPIRGNDVVTGVLYLQDRIALGPFLEDDVTLSQSFTTYLAVFAERLLLKRRLRERADPTHAYREALRLSNFVGRSAAIADTLAQVALVSPLDVTVLLTGDSGTGKTHLARILHENSPRAALPFVELNCAVIPESLMESELFGALPGEQSFATGRIEGKIKGADHGTLFLDEVSVLTPAVQVKLLQFLQSGQYYPTGAQAPLTADVRIFAATNADLRAKSPRGVSVKTCSIGWKCSRCGCPR